MYGRLLSYTSSHAQAPPWPGEEADLLVLRATLDILASPRMDEGARNQAIRASGVPSQRDIAVHPNYTTAQADHACLARSNPFACGEKKLLGKKWGLSLPCTGGTLDALPFPAEVVDVSQIPKDR